jgi:hypothetical protein
MFGYQSTGNQNQVYFDPAKQQYYTMSGFGMNREKNYLNGMGLNNTSNQSQIQQMLAARQPFQYNAPSAQQLFPGMGNPMMGTMPTQAQGNPMFSGNFGAGRFLGQGYGNQSGLLGSSSTSMLGS